MTTLKKIFFSFFFFTIFTNCDAMVILVNMNGLSYPTHLITVYPQQILQPVPILHLTPVHLVPFQQPMTPQPLPIAPMLDPRMQPSLPIVRMPNPVRQDRVIHALPVPTVQHISDASTDPALRAAAAAVGLEHSQNTSTESMSGRNNRSDRRIPDSELEEIRRTDPARYTSIISQRESAKRLSSERVAAINARKRARYAALTKEQRRKYSGK